MSINIKAEQNEIEDVDEEIEGVDEEIKDTWSVLTFEVGLSGDERSDIGESFVPWTTSLQDLRTAK